MVLVVSQSGKSASTLAAMEKVQAAGLPVFALTSELDSPIGRRCDQVLDIHTGEIIKQLDVGDSLAVKFNAKRNELYITQRESGKLLSLDATTYAVKQTWDLPPNPNSLLLSEDGQTLYVTVKQPFNKDHSTSGPDSVVRISLK